MYIYIIRLLKKNGTNGKQGTTGILSGTGL